MVSCTIADMRELKPTIALLSRPHMMLEIGIMNEAYVACFAKVLLLQLV